jgi:hypothetical protein
MMASQLGDGECLDRLYVLDAGIVDEHVDLAERLRRFGNHARDLLRLGHVGRRVGDLDTERLLDLGARALDLGVVAKAVERDRHPRRGEGARDAEPDAAR